jgi:hypothetical protein
MKKFLISCRYIVLTVITAAVISVVLFKLGITILYSYAAMVLPYAVIVYALLDVLSGIVAEKKKFGEFIFDIAVVLTIWALCLS